jgi:hypothetical protein
LQRALLLLVVLLPLYGVVKFACILGMAAGVLVNQAVLKPHLSVHCRNIQRQGVHV